MSSVLGLVVFWQDHVSIRFSMCRTMSSICRKGCTGFCDLRWWLGSIYLSQVQQVLKIFPFNFCLRWGVLHMACPLSRQSLDATLTVGIACEVPTRSSIFFETRVPMSRTVSRWFPRFLYLPAVVNAWVAEHGFVSPLHPGCWWSSLTTIFHLNSQEYGGTWYNALLLLVIAYRPCKQSLLFLNSGTLWTWFTVTPWAVLS